MWAVDQWATEDIPNAWGHVPVITQMQSEAGVAGALHGALQPGGLTTTFTCYDGATPRASVEDCDSGDTYEVTVQTDFDLVTPILEPIFGSSISIDATATGPVLNSAFDPSARANSAFCWFPPESDKIGSDTSGGRPGVREALSPAAADCRNAVRPTTLVYATSGSR